MTITDFERGARRIAAMSRSFSLPSLFHDPAWRPRWAGMWVALMLVVAVAALSPGAAAPSMSPSDKLDHLLAFGALAVAGGLALHEGWRSALVVAASMVTYGGLIELAQTQVPGRFGDSADLLADTVGVALGLAAVRVLRRVWRADSR